MSEVDQTVLFLLEATVSLYPAGVDRAPDLTRPIWVEATANGLRIAERQLKVETKPTGRAYPRQHTLINRWSITMERVWLVDLAGGDSSDLEPVAGSGGQQYVLDVVWRNEDPVTGGGLCWRRETFYGVTREDGSRESDGVTEFKEGQGFDAERRSSDHGTGEVAVISATEPYVVKWVGAEGVVGLYQWNAETGLFAAQGSLPTGRAQIVQTGGTSFKVQFAGQADPAVEMTELGLYCGGGLNNGVCLEKPRLEFWQGDKRVLTIGNSGALHAYAFEQDPAGLAAAAGLVIPVAGDRMMVVNRATTWLPGIFSSTPHVVDGAVLLPGPGSDTYWVRLGIADGVVDWYVDPTPSGIGLEYWERLVLMAGGKGYEIRVTKEIGGAADGGDLVVLDVGQTPTVVLGQAVVALQVAGGGSYNLGVTVDSGRVVMEIKS